MALLNPQEYNNRRRLYNRFVDVLSDTERRNINRNMNKRLRDINYSVSKRIIPTDISKRNGQKYKFNTDNGDIYEYELNKDGLIYERKIVKDMDYSTGKEMPNSYKKIEETTYKPLDIWGKSVKERTDNVGKLQKMLDAYNDGKLVKKLLINNLK